MGDGATLEKRLRDLIGAFSNLKQEKLEMGRLIAVQDDRIRELGEQGDALRSRIDEMGKDRFTVKQLKDERKVIRRKLETALTRLNALEKEL